MTRPTKMLWATLALGAGLGASGVVHASPEATFNSCWGQTTKAFAALDTGIIGQHSRAGSGFTADPGDGGREGVGNVSKDTGTLPGDGGQGVHAAQNVDIANRNPDALPGTLPECDGVPVP